METGIEIGRIVFQALNIVFLFWPIILLVPLALKEHKLRTVALLWVFLAIIRPIYAVSRYPKLEFLITEPLYTLIFAISGLVLLDIWIVSKWPFRTVQNH